MYSKGYTKEDHKIATRMSRIRKKIEAGTATQMEKATLADYERKKGRRTRPPAQVPASHQAPVGGDVIQQSPPSPPPQPPVPPESPPVEVHTDLPGGGGEFVPPPLSVGGAAAPGPSTPPAQGSAATATTGSAPTPPKQGPAMSKEEAEASGTMIANVATQILSEFNDFNLKHGANGFDPKSEFFKMFHFSVKRLAVKYGAAIDEDQYDALVIVGAGGFVGWNSYKVYTRQEKNKVIEMAPPAKEAPPNGQQSRQQPANGSQPVERAKRVVFSGGPGTVPAGYRGNQEFDPQGPY